MECSRRFHRIHNTWHNGSYHCSFPLHHLYLSLRQTETPKTRLSLASPTSVHGERILRNWIDNGLTVAKAIESVSRTRALMRRHHTSTTAIDKRRPLIGRGNIQSPLIGRTEIWGLLIGRSNRGTPRLTLSSSSLETSESTTIATMTMKTKMTTMVQAMKTTIGVMMTVMATMMVTATTPQKRGR